MHTNNHERKHQRFRRKNYKRWSIDMCHLIELCSVCGIEDKLRTPRHKRVQLCVECAECAAARSQAETPPDQ